MPADDRRAAYLTKHPQVMESLNRMLLTTVRALASTSRGIASPYQPGVCGGVGMPVGL
jgi:hypothetical protein